MFKTEKHWYCESEKGDNGVWCHPTKYTLRDFVEEFKKLHEDATQHYLRKERNEFRKKFCLGNSNLTIVQQGIPIQKLLSRKTLQYKRLWTLVP